MLEPDAEEPIVSEMMPLAAELTRVYAEMSGLLRAEEAVQSALTLVASLALDALPGSIGAGATLVDADGRRVTAGATDPRVAEADAMQYRLGEGPCITACAEGVVVRVDDVEADERWPRWREAVRPRGLRSSLSAPMTARGTVLGALKVYAGSPDVFGLQSEALLTRYAEQAAVLLDEVQSLDHTQRLSEDLQRALRGRNTIALASGILMERHQLNEDQAFLRLVRDAGRAQRGLLDVAGDVVRSAGLRNS